MSNPKYTLIIFDWDGTLMDSSSRIVSCLQNAAADTQLLVPSDDQARQVIGLNLSDCLLKLFGELSDQQISDYIDRYRYHFSHPKAHDMKMFEGVLEGLENLNRSGYLLAVATGKGRRGLEPILAEYNLHKHFVMTRCADESRGKPHPQMLLDILEFTGLNADQAVMVGDTSYDLEMANNAGIDSVAVDYGMHDIDQLVPYNPVKIISQFSQLSEWLDIDS